MYTGGIDFRKNMEGAIAGYAHIRPHLRASHQFVIAGHMLDSERMALERHAGSLGVAGRVVFPGFVPDDLLRDLYQSCDLFIFPALYEGLGLPILEAMRCGAPVIVSNRSSTRELVEVPEARFDPGDPVDMARCMDRALIDSEFRETLARYSIKRSAEFTWERVAEVTAGCYNDLASPGRRNSVVKGRARLAVCTPYPPQESGIADYTKVFIEALAQRHPVQIDVVVNGDLHSYAKPAHKDIDIISIRQFRWLANMGHYDSIVYAMGNSPFHDYIYELQKEFQGSLWLHDVRLSGFYRWYFGERLGRDISKLPEELTRWASRYPSNRGDVLMRDMATQHRQGIYLAGEMANRADNIIVGSQFSKEALIIDTGVHAPVYVIPHASLSTNGTGDVYTTHAGTDAPFGLPASSSVAVSIGIVGPPKCAESIVDAFALLASGRQNLVLTFVGPVDPPYQRALESRAIGLSTGQIIFTGYVDEGELEAWLAKARCAVQLRFPTNGESSGAVMRCLTAGIPTIVSDHGPMRELPDDSVVKVPAPVEPQALADVMLRLLESDDACARLRDGALRYADEVSLERVVNLFWNKVLSPSRA